MSFGPNPWQQAHWDWRAAANFMLGGAGAGLIEFSAPAARHPILVVVGLALIAAGLACVWMEIGRPLRALHVFFNPQTSWMTREGMVATLLIAVGLASVVAWPKLGDIAALLALGFLWCQGKILHASKGIPAWREPRVVPFVVVTGLAEGGALLMLLAPGRIGIWHVGAVAALVVLRLALWVSYRKRLAARARTALAPAERGLIWGGTLVPLVLMACVAAEALPQALLSLAGLLATAAGAWIKFVLVTRAGFNQGFALAQLPVRGVRR